MTDPAHDPTILTATAATAGPAAAAPAAPARLPHYRVANTIGVGGMGEVLLAHDERIGRDIAVKRMRTVGGPEAVTRFLREARIQARLEHPAIVPVYEIGRGDDGSPFFAMKRISGTTLAALIHGGGASEQRLLNALVDVCQAVEFAHTRGVVHRDLKPANIIAGAFGEVYVLDWGLAHVDGEREIARGGEVASLDGLTQAGTTLGTPGYMAPEQIRDAAHVGPAADVYALGAILFEILARVPLHVPGLSALTSTLAGGDSSPARRRDAVPPELDALCVVALSLDPAARPSAGALADGIQRYLDGDRDVVRRREVSAGYLDQARALLASTGADAHLDALREAGRAFALDLDNRAAAELFTAIILAPPRVQSAELRAHLAASDIAIQQRQSRLATVMFVGVAAFLVASAWNGILSWPLLLVLGGMAATMAFAAFWLSTRAPGVREMTFVAVGNALLAALLSRAFGSLIVVPGVTCVMALSLTSYPQLIARGRAVIAILVASWAAPVALERMGVLVPTWAVERGAVRSVSRLVEVGANTEALLIGTNIATIIAIGLFANALASSRQAARHAVEVQAWQLRKLVPAAVDRAGADQRPPVAAAALPLSH